jgi:hypothetical protein
MSVAIHEREASHDYEVLVNTDEEVLLLCNGLNRFIAEQRLSQSPNEKVLQEAELFRQQVGEDVTKVLRGEMISGLPYRVKDKTVLNEVLTKTQQDEQPAVTEQKSVEQPTTPVPTSVSRSSNVPRLVWEPRITSFFDPRLDEKRSRWFSR